MNRQGRAGGGGKIETRRRCRAAQRCIGDALIANVLMSPAGLLFARPVFSLPLAATRVFDGMAQRVQRQALLRKQQQESQPDQENAIAGHAEY